MNDDELRILAHLALRRKTSSTLVEAQEIESAWAFKAFPAALKKVVERGYVQRVGHLCRITNAGMKALKVSGGAK